MRVGVPIVCSYSLVPKPHPFGTPDLFSRRILPGQYGSGPNTGQFGEIDHQFTSGWRGQILLTPAARHLRRLSIGLLGRFSLANANSSGRKNMWTKPNPCRVLAFAFSLLNGYDMLCMNFQISQHPGTSIFSRNPRDQ